MKKMSCEILLENYDGEYNPSSEILGKVKCLTSSILEKPPGGGGPKVISLQCIEHTQWEADEEFYDIESNSVKKRQVTLATTNEIFLIQHSLENATEMESENSFFRFNFVLPYLIPSTFASPYGYIRYKLKAIIDGESESDEENFVEINVQSTIQVHDFPPEYLNLNIFHRTKSIRYCYCCKGGLIYLQVDLPKIVFVPGETVDFKVSITNSTFLCITKVTIKLIQAMRYRVVQPFSEILRHEDIIVHLVEKINKGRGEEVCDFKMAIPDSLEVPNFAGCSLFRIDYYLKISAKIRCYSNLNITIFPSFAHELSRMSSKNVLPILIPHTVNLAQRSSASEGFPILHDVLLLGARQEESYQRTIVSRSNTLSE